MYIYIYTSRGDLQVIVNAFIVHCRVALYGASVSVRKWCYSKASGSREGGGPVGRETVGLCCMHMHKHVAMKLCSMYFGFSSALLWKPSTEFVGPCTSVETFKAKFVGPCTSVEIVHAKFGALHFCDNLPHSLLGVRAVLL